MIARCPVCSTPVEVDDFRNYKLSECEGCQGVFAYKIQQNIEDYGERRIITEDVKTFRLVQQD